MEPLTISRRSIANKVFGTAFVCAGLCGAVASPTLAGQIVLGMCVALIGLVVAIDRSVRFDPDREEVTFETSLFGVATIRSRVRGFDEFAAVAAAHRWDGDDGWRWTVELVERGGGAVVIANEQTMCSLRPRSMARWLRRRVALRMKVPGIAIVDPSHG